MGYQLWVSPLTGLRRRGTRLSDLRTLLANGITVRALFEPIQSCPSEAAADEMHEILLERDFDVAGVQTVQDGLVIGYVTRESLIGGRVGDHLQHFAVGHLVSEATPLQTLFQHLLTRDRAFVLIGTNVGGIVTRADLNKPPVRVYLFGLVSLLEMHLQFWIREKCSDNSWQDYLTNGRIKKALQLHDQLRGRNEEVSLVDCLQFCDKREIVIRDKELSELLGLGSTKEARTFLKNVERLRNLLAHSRYDIHITGWEPLLNLVGSIETVLQKSDLLVEERASHTALQFQNKLSVATI